MIYLDHHAATPLAPAARRAMADARERAWANPSSAHAAGRAARQLLEGARRRIAEGVGAKPADLVFTAGGTEACNLALHGLLSARPPSHVVSSALEHPAVLARLRAYAARGADLTMLALSDGQPPSPAALADALRPDTAMVALQWVNHEVGAISDVAAYAAVCSARGIPLVVDASQALGKVLVDVGALGATAVVFTAAKLGGPSGAGALWVDRRAALAPLVLGGAQERGRRAGTPDVAAFAGFAAAVEGIGARLAAVPTMARSRDRLEAACLALGAVANAPTARVASVCNLSVRGWRGEVLVAALDVEGLCASSGAACSSGLGEPSPVLRALYPDEPWRAESALRLSLGPETTEAEIDQAIAMIGRVLARSGFSGA